MLAEDRLRQRHRVVDARLRRAELDVAGLVVELHVHVLVVLADAAELVDEVHVPGRAAELAVGDGCSPTSSCSLTASAIAASSTARRASASMLAGGEVVARGEQLGRAQQAADVVGPEGRGGAEGHSGSVVGWGVSAARLTSIR